MIDHAENFESFFTKSQSKVLDVRNVHLLNYRNFGSSDHHKSMDMDDIADDIIRYMDQNYITTATIGGHGFGAKVAIATATDNLNRFTGVMCLDGGPVDQRYHDSYTELRNSIKKLAKVNIESLSAPDINKNIDRIVTDPNWNKIFKKNVNTTKGAPQWDFNINALVEDMKKVKPVVATWSESYGLWPGRAWVQIPSYSKWIHLSTNTLPFYDVFPRLNNQFPSSEFNLFGNEETSASHFPHLSSDPQEIFHLSNRMWRFLRFKDGVNVLLADRSEVGWQYIPDRGSDPSTGTAQGEYIPEHVHHNWKHTSKISYNCAFSNPKYRRI